MAASTKGSVTLFGRSCPSTMNLRAAAYAMEILSQPVLPRYTGSAPRLTMGYRHTIEVR
jgi:hypothetical protein